MSFFSGTALSGVLSVTKSRFYRTHTTRSWDFLGLEYNQPNGLLTKAKNGEGIIVCVNDSGYNILNLLVHVVSSLL